MDERIDPSGRTSLAQLQAWYLGSLRPKLGNAAASGEVDWTAAAALDVRIRDLLELRREETFEAAA